MEGGGGNSSNLLKIQWSAPSRRADVSNLQPSKVGVLMIWGKFDISGVGGGGSAEVRVCFHKKLRLEGPEISAPVLNNNNNNNNNNNLYLTLLRLQKDYNLQRQWVIKVAEIECRLPLITIGDSRDKWPLFKGSIIMTNRRQIFLSFLSKVLGELMDNFNLLSSKANFVIKFNELAKITSFAYFCESKPPWTGIRGLKVKSR